MDCPTSEAPTTVVTTTQAKTDATSLFITEFLSRGGLKKP